MNLKTEITRKQSKSNFPTNDYFLPLNTHTFLSPFLDSPCCLITDEVMKLHAFMITAWLTGNWSLTHFTPLFHIYTTWKRQKTSGFSGGKEMKQQLKHWKQNKFLKYPLCSYIQTIVRILYKYWSLERFKWFTL